MNFGRESCCTRQTQPSSIGTDRKVLPVSLDFEMSIFTSDAFLLILIIFFVSCLIDSVPNSICLKLDVGNCNVNFN